MQRYDDLAVAEFVSKTKERTGTDIMNKKEKYHRFTEPVILILQLKLKNREQRPDSYEDGSPII